MKERISREKTHVEVVLNYTCCDCGRKSDFTFVQYGDGSGRHTEYMMLFPDANDESWEDAVLIEVCEEANPFDVADMVMIEFFDCDMKLVDMTTRIVYE